MGTGTGTAHCLFFMRGSEVFGNITLPDSDDIYTFPSIDVDVKKLELEAERFWLSIDSAMKERLLAEGAPPVKGRNYTSLVARGAALRECLADRDLIWRLEQAAREADILHVVTNMLWFPWEAIYFGNVKSGAFLGHLATVVRKPLNGNAQPEATSEPPEDDVESDETQTFVLDPILETLKIGAAAGNEQLVRALLEERTKGTSTVILSSERDHGFAAQARKSMVVHWICEHENAGLRLEDGYHFTEDDCRVVPLGRGLIILAGCETGGGRGGRSDFAGFLCRFNGLAVAAPTAKLGLETAVAFTLKLHAAFHGRGKNRLRVLDLWRGLIDENDQAAKPLELTVAACFVLLFGLYGRVRQTLAV